jgi:hypothetical protein
MRAPLVATSVRVKPSNMLVAFRAALREALSA